VVSPPPNLTVVSGRVLARRPHDTLPDWDAVTLAVDSTAPVPGLRDLVGPNLAAPNQARTPATVDQDADLPELVIAVRRDLLGAAAPGWHLTVRVKHTPNGPMAEQHPGTGDLVVGAGEELSDPPTGAETADDDVHHVTTDGSTP
jgi:hypothetical protein